MSRIKKWWYLGFFALLFVLPHVSYGAEWDFSTGYYNLNPCVSNGSLTETFTDMNGVSYYTGVIINLNSDCSNWNGYVGVVSQEAYFDAREIAPYPNPPYYWIVKAYDGVNGTGNLIDTYYRYWNGDMSSDPDLSTGTRIVSVVPFDTQVIATSTNSVIGSEVFIDENDFEEGMYVEQQLVKTADVNGIYSAGASPVLYTRFYNYSLHSGYNYVSTTTDIIESGEYQLKTNIRRDSTLYNIASFFSYQNVFNYGLVMSTTTYFIASTTSAWDDFVNDTVTQLDNFFASTTLSMDSCSTWTSFSLTGCMGIMFGYQKVPMERAFGQIKDNLARDFPFGYVTRFVEILTASTTQSIPPISYTFASDFPVSFLANQTMSYDVDTLLNEGVTVLNNDLKSTGSNPLSVWAIFQILVTWIIYLTLFFMIFNDVVQIYDYGIPHDTGSQKASKENARVRGEYYKNKGRSYSEINKRK